MRLLIVRRRYNPSTQYTSLQTICITAHTPPLALLSTHCLVRKFVRAPGPTIQGQALYGADRMYLHARISLHWCKYNIVNLHYNDKF